MINPPSRFNRVRLLGTELFLFLFPWKKRIRALEAKCEALQATLLREIRMRIDEAKTYAHTEHKLGELRMFSRTQAAAIGDMEKKIKNLESELVMDLSARGMLQTENAALLRDIKGLGKQVVDSNVELTQRTERMNKILKENLGKVKSILNSGGI